MSYTPDRTVPVTPMEQVAVVELASLTSATTHLYLPDRRRTRCGAPVVGTAWDKRRGPGSAVTCAGCKDERVLDRYMHGRRGSR